MNVMKKIVFLLAFLILTSACNTRGPIPYGVWKSEKPDIILYLAPETELFADEAIPGKYYPGTYIKNGENRNAIIGFGYSKEFIIYDEEVFLTEKRISENMLYVGNYRVKGNKLRYNLVPHWKEQTGIKTIVFEKVSDYEIE